MPSDERKVLQRIRVEPDTHDWLIREANKVGEPLDEFAGKLLDDCAISWKPPAVGTVESDGDRDRVVFWSWTIAMRRRRQIERMYQVAAACAENPCEETATLLEQMCDALGINYEAVMAEADENPFSSVIAFGRNGSKLSSCIKWLVELMQQRRTMTVREICALAEKKGFKESMVKQARGAINQNVSSPAIISRRTSDGWTWELTE